ncbi:MAG: MerR family transcriptional regulator [Micrococcales bacterium]|nr:MerR family transcriptional regulator [Micrococcales bacterium]
MSIGDALEQLVAEFPAVSITKLRYLEDIGLVAPARSAGGYRKYSQADVERLRFVLTAQRDHYWPLTVIRARLAGLDSGLEEAPEGLLGPRTAVASASVGIEEVAVISGAPASLVEEVARAAGLAPGTRGIDAALVQAVEACVELGESGLDLRHLRPLFATSRKVADLVEAAAAAQRGRGSAGRERAAAHAAEMAECMARLNQALVRLALAEREL